MSYKLPENLIETLKAEAEKRGATQTALMIQGLQHVLGIASSTAVDAADIDLRIESAIAPLRLEVDALKAAIEALRIRIANQPTYLQNQPSENAPTSVVKKAAVRLDATICPKCESGNTAPWGKGRLRSDGTRGHKIMCGACKRVSTIG